jgi:hypothetical protein
MPDKTPRLFILQSIFARNRKVKGVKKWKMQNRNRIMEIPPWQMLESLEINGIQVISNYTNVIDVIVSNSADTCAMVPAYADENSLLRAILSTLKDDLWDKWPGELIEGDINSIPEGTSSVGVFNCENARFVGFVYTHVWRRKKSETIKSIVNLSPILQEVGRILPMGITTLVIPIFAANNGYTFHEVAFVIHSNIRAACEEGGPFSNIGLRRIVLCAPAGFPTTRVVDHLRHLNFLVSSSLKPCVICYHAPPTHFSVNCGHMGMCIQCATGFTMKLDVEHTCPFCKCRSKIEMVPLLSEGVGDKLFFPSCGCVVIKSDRPPVARHCLLDIRGSIKMFSP